MHLCLASLLLVLLAVAATADPIAITNANFEMPALADGGSSFLNVPGWVAYGGVGYGVWTYNPTTAQYALEAPQGENVVGLFTVNSAGVLQVLSDTYQAGYTYSLSAWVGDRDDYARANFEVALLAFGSIFSSSSNPLPPEGGYSLVTTVFEADSSVDGEPIEIRLIALPSSEVDPDQDPGSGGTVVDFDDVQLSFEPTVTAAPMAAPGLTLHAPSPNPFNPRTTARFELQRPGWVDVDVYDAAGRRVRALLVGEQVAAGGRSVEWDGRDDFGRPAASGVYFWRFRAGAESATARVLLLK